MDSTQEIVFSSGQMFLFFLRGLLLLIMPFAGYAYLHRKHGTGFFPMFTGFITVMLILLPRQMVRSMLTPAAESLTGKWLTVWFVGAVFEECWRYIAMKYGIPGRDTLTDALCYGLGHGGAETVMSAVMQFRILYEASAMTGEHLEAYAQQGWLTLLAVTLGQVLNLATHTALSVLVARAVHYEGCKKLLPVAIFLHVLGNFTDFCFDLPGDLLLTAVICAGVYLHGKQYPDGLI
jgi:uncharacterized membrane protein YhfC